MAPLFPPFLLLPPSHLHTTIHTGVRHPPSLRSTALAHGGAAFSLTFTKYDQSHRCLTQVDSSVSYASAVLVAAASDGGAANGCLR